MATDSIVRREPPSEPIGGWGRIAARVTRRIGLQVSPDTARRWAKRADDPLPVRRWTCGKRPHVVADGCELDAWCDRQWVVSRPDEREVQRVRDASMACTNGSKGDGEG